MSKKNSTKRAYCNNFVTKPRFSEISKNSIEIHRLSKIFSVPHEKKDTLKEHFTRFFRRIEYQSFSALDDINLTIEKGDFFGIVGLNGSGKSTLLKILAHIYKPTNGEVHVQGSLSPFLELGVGFNGELTGRENVFLNGKILGLSDADIKKKYKDIVEFAELEEFMDMKVKNYSSGMNVRLAFATAIQADADIFLCDEVLAVGDMYFQQKCFDIFQELKNKGKTIVFVSHDLASIRRFCTKCALLEHGKLIASGPTNEVLDRYIYGQGEVKAAEHPKATELPLKPVIDHGNKKIEIVSADFFDKNGAISTTFLTGDPFEIRIRYKKNENVSDCVFGIAIYGENGEYFYGTNTLLQKKTFHLRDEGAVILKVRKNVLLKGKL
ncbi:ABC transporter ATP-binding protein, partial [Candidatus Peregrinibacteria bacterium]|nr:ABC transporter ATP-binding protein [Candidatus Peregrinibacteria bacterium]